MKKKTLLLISITFSLIGILLLHFIAPDVSLQLIALHGDVKFVNSKEKISFIDFVPDNFSAVYFGNDEIPQGSHVLYGRLQKYKGRIEFVVEDYD